MKKSLWLPRVRLQLFSWVLAPDDFFLFFFSSDVLSFDFLEESDIRFPSSTYTEVEVGEFIARACIKLSNQIGSSKPIILL